MIDVSLAYLAIVILLVVIVWQHSRYRELDSENRRLANMLREQFLDGFKGTIKIKKPPRFPYRSGNENNGG